MNSEFAMDIPSMPGLDALETRTWHYFFESASLFIDVLNRRLVKAHELTLFDVRLLDLLDRAEGGEVRMGDVAEALTLQPSRVTEQVRRLESAGLVRRHHSKRDRRSVIASLTDAGRARLRPAMATYARVIRAHYLNQMTRQQMTALGESSRRVVAEVPTRLSPR